MGKKFVLGRAEKMARTDAFIDSLRKKHMVKYKPHKPLSVDRARSGNKSTK